MLMNCIKVELKILYLKWIYFKLNNSLYRRKLIGLFIASFNYLTIGLKYKGEDNIEYCRVNK